MDPIVLLYATKKRSKGEVVSAKMPLLCTQEEGVHFDLFVPALCQMSVRRAAEVSAK